MVSGLSFLGTWLALAGCGPKHVRLAAPHDKAVLAGMDEARKAHEQKSSVTGRILRVDGRVLKLAKEEPLEPGCHLLEAEVEYEIVAADDGPCLAFKTFGACDRVTRYKSGRRHFAIPMRAGKRYELSARITEEGAWVYFVEVDAELGTVARFPPVRPGTTACAPGISL